MKKFWITLGGLLALGVILFVFVKSSESQLVSVELPESISYQQTKESFGESLKEEVVDVGVEVKEEKEVEKESGQEISEEEGVSEEMQETEQINAINLAVPFTPQAPHANWDMPYQEACEEASILMVDAYYQGVDEGLMDKEEVDSMIKEMVQFQEEELGFTPDMTAEETVHFITAAFGYEAEVIKNPSIEELKDQLRTGHPVIIPAAGQELNNPYFTPPGPVYHMLVLRGFTDTQFITNDPGTRRGEAYLYDVDVVMGAMHDWNGGDVESGAKVAIIIYP
jgi:hypothetical protein